MAQKIIQLDVDGVLADFVWGFTKLIGDRFLPGVVIPFSTSQHMEWDFDYIYPQVTIDKAWNWIKQSDFFWRDLPKLEGFLDVLDHPVLTDEGYRYQIYFVTIRVGRSALDQTRDWVGDLGFDPNVIISKNKAEIAKALKTDYAIEDKAGNAVMIDYWTDHKTKSYILDYPYNRFDAKVLGSHVRRVNTLRQFLDDVEAGR